MRTYTLHASTANPIVMSVAVFLPAFGLAGRAPRLSTASSNWAGEKDLNLQAIATCFHAALPLVGEDGIEPSTFPLSGECSTTELHAKNCLEALIAICRIPFFYTMH